MGKRKIRKKSKSDKPYCWYCDRNFQDEKILIQHQKAKHFKCNICHKKLSSASGMVVHVFQVHKETVSKIPNAKPGRDSVKNDVIGMDGIPGEEVEDDDGEPESKKLKIDSNPVIAVPPSFNPYSNPFGVVPPFTMPPFGVPPNPAPWYPGTNTNAPPGNPINPPIPPQVAMNRVPNPSVMNSPPAMTTLGPPTNFPGAINRPPHTPPIRGLGNMPRGPPPIGPPIGRGGPLQPPPQLFPVQSSTGTNETGGTSPQTYGPPSSPRADGQKSGGKIIMIYDDPEISTEEKRASLERYNYAHRLNINPENDTSKTYTTDSTSHLHTKQNEEELSKTEEH
jgi:hypothetical protein